MDNDTITFDTIADDWGHPVEAIEVYARNIGLTPDEMADYRDDFEDAYIGEMGLRDYVEEIVQEDTRSNESWLFRYIDIDAIVRDFGYEGYWESNGHLFHP